MKLREYLIEDDAAAINKFLAAMGFGPDYKPLKPEPPKKYECPKCKKETATMHEVHPDTDMNTMELRCPCGYEEEV